MMDKNTRRSRMAARVIRPGEVLPERDDWADATPEVRMEAVWELSRLCAAWGGALDVEPRLQRSIVRTLRGWK